MCPNTQELVRERSRRVCTAGYSYERTAVEKWLGEHNTSFVTGEPLSSQDLVPNMALKNRLRDPKLISCEGGTLVHASGIL